MQLRFRSGDKPMKQQTIEALRKFIETIQMNSNTTFTFRMSRAEAADVLALIAEVERLRAYESECERAASILQTVLIVGELKHIGLLEVAAGVEQLRAELAAERERAERICDEEARAIDGELPDASGGKFAKKFAANALRGAAALIRDGLPHPRVAECRQ